jgi:hypothetical protein
MPTKKNPEIEPALDDCSASSEPQAIPIYPAESLIVSTGDRTSLSYKAELVYGYLVRSGKLDLSIKIGALALSLSLTPEEVSSALDELKQNRMLELFTTAAIVRLKGGEE